MTCDELRLKLDAFVDDSVAADELDSVHEHLRSCPSCAAEALARLQIKRATRAAADCFAPTPAFRLKIESVIQQKRRQAWRFGWAPALASLALAVVLLGVPGALWLQHSSRQQAVAHLVDLHISTLASANPVDVVSTDRHTVKPWFQGKLPFTFNLPELDNSPFKLVGGKLEYIRQNPGAHLLFNLRNHELSVFITQQDKDRRVSDVDPISSQESGFNIESWQKNGLSYVVVSDAGSSDVHALSELLRAAASQ